MKHYVIIGNGVAATGCIEGIRRQDADGTITVVSEEDYAVYCRPLISYYLEGKTDAQRMQYRPEDFYEKNGCTVLYGKKAVSGDAANKTVTLDDGTCLSYDALCVATGSSAFVPPFQGLESVQKKFTFMTLDDTYALEQAISDDSRVLIVGAGLIGLKCAEGLHGRVAKITVCDLADRVLSSILDTDCAEKVQAHLERNGIEFLLGDSVQSFDAQTAHMNSGKCVPFDVLVLAVGVRANTALVRDMGGETDRGILIDTAMRTTLPDVYAAGDCTQGLDSSCGEKKVLALLPNAYMQGRCAGVNMAGGEDVFDKAIPMNSIGFFGLHIMTAGSYANAELVECGKGDNVRRLYVRDGLLCGFILVGDTSRAGIYTSMIRDKVPLDSVNFDLLKESATSAAFSCEKRRNKFGSVV